MIELIVVIGILGIFMMLATLRLSEFSSNAQETSDISTVRVIEGAACLYFFDYGVYPNTIGDIDEKYLDVDLNGFKDLSTTTPFDDDGKLSN
jgi:type II secretory pathway pseudopilin PulG